MHAAVGDEADQMARATAVPGGRDQLFQGRGLGNGAVPDSVADARELLVHHAAGADIQMTHFRIAHLAVRQTYIAAAGAQKGVRSTGP